ncbi:sensor histidine kinase [Paenibacillus silviterrae]|uniref:sensor histidine kinase n=1 Tax=Paenibacillus silviterrae TaxID=3242194 RepID=UPI002542E751|nr:sensor histidine kinase [Paenibacillus chinjuensis]
MKRWGQPLSIKRKMLLYFVVLFCLPFLLFSLLWYAKSAETIENSGIYYNEQLIGRVHAQLDEYFAGIKADSMALPGHPLIQEFIKADPYNTYEMYRLKGRISNELLPNMRKDMYGFSLLSQKGASFGDYSTAIMPLFQESFKILGIEERAGVSVITVYRKIIDNETYEPLGAIIMSLSLKQLLKISDLKPYGKNGSMVVANESGQIFFHTDKERVGAFLPSSWSDRMNGDKGRFELEGTGGKRLMVYQISDQTGFRIISETSQTELLGGLLRLQVLTLFIGAGILILGFAVFYRMFREIKKLLGEIHRTRMSEKELELKHRESLVSAMQSRINPHFLYNTLEIINAHAVVFNIKPISQMTVHLSNLFRYSVGNPEQVVSLRKELDHIMSYIRIQEQRFEGFSFIMNVDEEMLDQVYLFRLTLQPLIENAFQHAYEKHGLTPGSISIIGSAEEACYSLYIDDKGRGMPPELHRKYNQAFESMTEVKLVRASMSPFHGIGLWNVHSRLRLAFGEPYGLRICDSNENGTRIQVKLPYRKGVLQDVQSADCG